MKEVTVQELKQKLDGGEAIQLIDVREPYEHENGNIGGDLVPMNNIINQPDKIAKDKQVIVYCRSGNRSGVVIKELEKRYGLDNLWNLKGGIVAWAREIDGSVMG